MHSCLSLAYLKLTHPAIFLLILRILQPCQCERNQVIDLIQCRAQEAEEDDLTEARVGNCEEATLDTLKVLAEAPLLLRISTLGPISTTF